MLAEVARRLSGLTRAGDVLARVGGEEFALLLPETTNDNGFTLAEKLRQKLGSTVYEFAGKKIPVTMSIGLATLKPSHAGFDDLVAEADKNLYAAKNGGRNKVCR